MTMFDFNTEQNEIFSQLSDVVTQFRRREHFVACSESLTYNAGTAQTRSVQLIVCGDQLTDIYSLEFHWKGGCGFVNRECVRLMKGHRWEVEEYLVQDDLPEILMNNLFHWEKMHKPDADYEESLILPEDMVITYDHFKSMFAESVQVPFMSISETVCRKRRFGNIENHSVHLSLEDGVLYSADRKTLIFCFDEKTSFTVPETVTSIGAYAFCMQGKLVSVILPASLEHLGSGAFMNCVSLTNIRIPGSLRVISSDAFNNCHSLDEIIIEDGVQVISIDAFRHCRSLKKIDFPTSLHNINGFSCCFALEEVCIPGGVENVAGFEYCRALRKVTLSPGVRKIDDYAFRGCVSLEEITIPEGVVRIGSRAFMPDYDGTNRLHSIVLPSTLEAIEDEAFYYCQNLSSVKFQSVVKELGISVFACCSPKLRNGIVKPADLVICDDVLEQDRTLDKFGFLD